MLIIQYFSFFAEAARGSSLRATEAESRTCQTFGKAGLVFYTHTCLHHRTNNHPRKYSNVKELSMWEVVWSPHLPMIQQQHDERKWTTGNDYHFPILINWVSCWQVSARFESTFVQSENQQLLLGCCLFECLWIRQRVGNKDTSEYEMKPMF